MQIINGKYLIRGQLASDCGASLASALEQIEVDLRDLPASEVVSSFFSGFLKQFYASAPELLPKARALRWGLRHEFQRQNVARWMTGTISLWDLEAMSPTERTKALAQLVREAKAPRTGQGTRIDDRIRALEEKYGMSSDEARDKFRRGELEDNAETSAWMVILTSRRHQPC